MKKILIPIDGSEYSARAIEKGKEVARAFGSQIILLNVINPFMNPLTPNLTVEESMLFVETMKKQSEKVLEDTKNLFLHFDDIELVSLEGDVASTISRYAEENDVDLVVMGSQGVSAGTIRGLFIGSVTRKVVYSIHKPILIIK